MLDAMRGYKILVPLITPLRYPGAPNGYWWHSLEEQEAIRKNEGIERVNG
jgi:hypothetical protein